MSKNINIKRPYLDLGTKRKMLELNLKLKANLTAEEKVWASSLSRNFL